MPLFFRIMETDYNLEQSIYNAILQVPYSFEAGERKFYLYPVTLGKDMLLRQHVRAVEAVSGIGAENVQEMALKAVRTQKKEVLRILAINTLDRKEELLDEYAISERIMDLDSVLEEEEEAALLVICLNEFGNLVTLLRDTGIEAERENMRTIQKVKKENRNSIQFGGRTVYGRLLDVACERYGWTLDYLLWGISMTNLQLMLADQINSVFLSDEELKALDSEDGEECIDADDPDSRERLHDMLGG